jgi:hypothetical protein
MARVRSAEEPQLLSDDVSGGLDGFDFSGFGFRFHQYRSRRRCSFRQGRDSQNVLGDGGALQVNDETTQRTCLRLMGWKMLVALVMEGKFSGEGIHSMDADDDLLAAMARELVEQGGIGESADRMAIPLIFQRFCLTSRVVLRKKPHITAHESLREFGKCSSRAIRSYFDTLSTRCPIKKGKSTWQS